MIVNEPQDFAIYFNGQRIGEAVGYARDAEREPAPPMGLAPKEFTCTFGIPMTPEQHAALMKVFALPRRSRLQRKLASKTLKARRRLLVRIAGAIGVTPEYKRALVHPLDVCRARGVRIPRSLR